MTPQITNEAREERIDPMWLVDEDNRRLAIMRREAAGARKTLAART